MPRSEWSGTDSKDGPTQALEQDLGSLGQVWGLGAWLKGRNVDFMFVQLWSQLSRKGMVRLGQGGASLSARVKGVSDAKKECANYHSNRERSSSIYK